MDARLPDDWEEIEKC